MSTTVATATTATTTVTSARGAISSTPTSSTATASATNIPVSSTATSSTPTATLGAGAAAPGTPFATPFEPGGAPFVTLLPSWLMPKSFTFEDYLQHFNTASLLLVGFPQPLTTDNIISLFGCEKMPWISKQRFRQPNKLTSIYKLMPSGRTIQLMWTYWKQDWKLPGSNPMKIFLHSCVKFAHSRDGPIAPFLT